MSQMIDDFRRFEDHDAVFGETETLYGQDEADETAAGGPFLLPPTGRAVAVPPTDETSILPSAPVSESSAAASPPVAASLGTSTVVALDPYAAIRPALSAPHAHLTAEEIPASLGRLPAIFALHQALSSWEPKHAVLAVLLGRAGRRFMPFNGTAVPIPTYLRMLSGLFREAADHGEQAETSAEAALAVRASTVQQPSLFSEEHGHPAVPAPPPLMGPPASVAHWPLGVDLDASTTGINDTAFANLKRLGKYFAILKSSQGRQDYAAWFAASYRSARNHGLIRGSYHFFANKTGAGHDHPWRRGTVAEQADLVIAQVPALLPGDLAPALDLEDEPIDPHTDHPPPDHDHTAVQRSRYPLDEGLLPDQQGYHYRARWPEHGRQAVLADVEDFLNRIETAFGRTPLIYTSRMWADTDDMNNPPDPDPSHPMANYPLWTVYHPTGARSDVGDMAVGNWAHGWKFIQYGEKGSQRDPKSYWFSNVHYPDYQEPGIAYDGIDFDAFQGSVSELRGLADIGRCGIAYAGRSPYVAYAGLDDHLHLLDQSTGADQDLQATLGGDAGDPTLLASATALFIYVRSGDHLVELIATVAAPTQWLVSNIEDMAAGGVPIKPLQDPRAVLSDGRCHVTYVGDDDDWHLLIKSGSTWQRLGGALTNAGLRSAPHTGIATGPASVYVSGAVTHIVGRVDHDGHLVDVAWDGAQWRHDDLTTLGRNLAPDMPAATYSPCVYETSAGVGVVFRAVRGDLWVIALHDGAPTNLMTATQTSTTRAKACAGHPTCFALHDQPHVVYRSTDSMIYEFWLEGGRWHHQPVCADPAHQAAADPVATTNGAEAVIAFRGADDRIHIERFDGNSWICDGVAAPAARAHEVEPPSENGGRSEVLRAHEIPSTAMPRAPVVDPFPNVTTDPLPLDTADGALNSLMSAVASDHTLSGLCAGLIDLTDNPAVPPYAGFNDQEMLFVGSLQKISAAYAAFELRSRVQGQVTAAVHAGLSTASAGWEKPVIAALEAAWAPKLNAAFPKLPSGFPKIAEIFTFSSTGGVDFAAASPAVGDERIDAVGELGRPIGKFRDWMRLMLRWSNDDAAGLCIRALSFPYINGVLAGAGLFDATQHNGLWLSADYANHDWLPNPPAAPQANRAGQSLSPRWQRAQGRKTSNITGTARQVARLMSRLATGKLVDTAADPEMVRLMTGASGIGSYIRAALANDGRAPGTVISKIGFGDDSRSHDCAIVERVAGGKPLRYVVVGLGSTPRSRVDLNSLFLRLDDIIVALHP